MSAAHPARPLYLELERGAVFALLDRPPASAAETAVLLVPPFGWQDTSSYRSRRAWARQLAAAGHPTLRIDLPASGDSAGGPRDPELVAAWVDAIAGAARWLAAEQGAARVAAVGIGLGGLLAWHAADAGAPIDALALWGAPTRGRAYVRELRALAALEAARATDPDGAGVPAGAVTAAGFLLSAETVAALSRIDLAAAPPPDGVGRVLLLERDGMPVDERLRERVEASEAELTVAPGGGYAAMLTAEPHEAEPSAEAFAQLRDWLARGERVGAGPARARASIAAPASADGAAIAVGDATVRERPLTVAQSFGELFGVLAEPDDDPAPLTAVLLNAGAQRRTGPSRLWTEVARRWTAVHRVPTLRLDLEGIGDADGEAGVLADVAGFYVDRYVSQVRAALDALETLGRPPRFVLFGLCSGAYWSFHGALADERVTAALMVNSRVLLWDDQLDDRREARKLGSVLKPAVWRRFLAGEMPRGQLLRTLRALPAALPQLLRRRLRSRSDAGADPLDVALAPLETSDRRLWMAFTAGEPLHAELERAGRLEAFAGSRAVEVVRVPGDVSAHTLEPLPLQRAVADLLDERLARELERQQARAGARTVSVRR